MTTIQHPASRFHFWWYVAAVALAAAVATLLFATLHDATAGRTDAPPASTTSEQSNESRSGRACFGMRHTDTIDLARAGCAAGLH